MSFRKFADAEGYKIVPDKEKEQILKQGKKLSTCKCGGDCRCK